MLAPSRVGKLGFQHDKLYLPQEILRYGLVRVHTYERYFLLP